MSNQNDDNNDTDENECLDFESFANVDPLSHRPTGNFNQINPKIHEKLYDLTSVCLKFFEKLQLLFWASSGTVLGAIRHKRVIPWDDDVDLCVATCQKMKFLKSNALTLMMMMYCCYPVSETKEKVEEERAEKQRENIFQRCSLFLKQEQEAFDLLKQHQVAFCVSPSVGLKFYFISSSSDEKNISSSSSSSGLFTEAIFPFVDVFIMKKISGIKELTSAQQGLLSNNKDEDQEDENDDDTENTEKEEKENSSEIFVIEDTTGRDLWAADFFFVEDCLSISWMEFGKMKIPISANPEKYLTRAYGSDWRTVARSHSINHESGQKQNQAVKPLNEIEKTLGESF